MVSGPLLTGGLTRSGEPGVETGSTALLVVPWFPWPQLFRRGPTATAASPDGSGGWSPLGLILGHGVRGRQPGQGCEGS